MTALVRIKVLVSFACPVLQAGLMATLARHADFHCSEAAASASIPFLPTLPDVIIADHVRGLGWVNAGARAAGTHALPPVLVVTHSDRECDIRAALSGGVQGYLLVDDVPEYLAAAVRAVRPGKRILSPQVASRLADNLALEPLTKKETAVLALVVEGLCNKAIGRRLDITTGTVKSHLRSAFGKLGAESRTQAIAIAHRRGLLQSQPDANHTVPAARSVPPPLFDHRALRPLGEQAGIGR